MTGLRVEEHFLSCSLGPWGAARSCPWSPTDHGYTFTPVERVGSWAQEDPGAMNTSLRGPPQRGHDAKSGLSWGPCGWCEEAVTDTDCVAGGPVGVLPPWAIPARGDENDGTRQHNPVLKMPR